MMVPVLNSMAKWRSAPIVMLSLRLFFPGGNIGELAINGTVNDLAMCGAIPQYLSLAFIIEEGLPMTEFWEILSSIKEAAQKANIRLLPVTPKWWKKEREIKYSSIHPASE